MANRGRPPKNGIMSIDDMITEQEKVKGNRIYKAESLEAASSAISQSVAYALGELKQAGTGERVSLDNTEMVKALTEKYLVVCSKTATLPTMSGLARVLGYTRDGIRWHMKNKPSSKTTEWLELFRDLCSDLLAQNALVGSVHPVVSIFLEKACYGLRDNITIETISNDDKYNNEPTAEELIERAKILYGDEMIDE